MARANPIISTFSGGELSPLLSSRPELEKYSAGMLLCENAIPRVQGALERRGGTRYVASTKANGRAWLVPFVFSITDAFLLEFGDSYIRFYRNRGTFEAVPTVHYEISSPYALADLTDEDGAFALRFEQSGDVVYITHAKRTYQPRKLTRASNTSWSLAVLEPEGGPFKDPNIDEDVTVYVTGAVTAGKVAVGESVTLTASSAIFQAGHVGSLFYLEVTDGRNIRPWRQRSLAVAASNTKCISDGKWYICTQDGGGANTVTGDVKPIHTSGKFWDGDGEDDSTDGYGRIGVEWEFLHPGYGWVEITGFTSTTVVTATVLSALPEEVEGAGDATWRWAHGAWSDVEGWPDTVTVLRERLTFLRERRFWCSVSGDYENFKAKDFGITDPSSAVSGEMQSGRGDVVKWVVSGKGGLLVGTGGGENILTEQTGNQVFGPGNTKAEPQEEWGSRGVQPARIGKAVMFVEKSGRAVRELKFNLEADAFTSDDTTEYAEHLFTSNVFQMAYARRPHSVLWCAREDGLLLGLTYSEKQGVQGWHRHPIGGSGIVESVATIPSPDGARDDVWLIVRRTINGATVRYVEYLAEEYEAGDDQALAAYYDSHLLYEGAFTTTVSGLDHLEGEVVSVKANGAAHADCTVSGGAITLSRSANKVVVGLSAPMRGRIMPLEAGTVAGTAQGKVKRVHKLVVRLINTLGGAFGPDLETLDAIEYRTTTAAMDAGPALFSGLKTLSFPGDYDAEATIAWEWDNGFPVTLVALMPEMAGYES